MLLDADCTVTVAHSKTRNLDGLLDCFDIIISAVGKPNLIDLKKCHADIVIDAGGDCYNFDPDYEWFGQETKVAITPNGIGLMTRAVLMAHVARVDVNAEIS
jgi:methylenetetrahydrofolate dehydrogenase (NADP+)/methenyltetrahydrofolate cyclohydrolase